MPVPDSFKAAVEEAERYWGQNTEDEEGLIPVETKKYLESVFKADSKNDVMSVIPYLKARFGQKVWHLKNGQERALDGIWFMVETNTSGQDENTGRERYDRGCFYQTNGLSEEEKENVKNAYKQHTALTIGEKSHYIPLRANETLPIGLGDDQNTIDFGELSFELAIRQPNGIVRDVDVVLDLGNTRSAGLLFDHAGKNAFSPVNFKQLFKVLRIKPDPMAWEYDSLDDVESGIVSSWIVLHQLEHQVFLGRDDSKEPKFLQTELRNIEVKEETTGFIFKKTDYHVTGDVCQRIPQMFMQLSPVLLGDQAERTFNAPYTQNMIKVGARLQQSSPKRYYWDDVKGREKWNMLLNKWDKSYTEKPEDATSLPTLQGEMLRFINDDGKILDLAIEEEPAKQPSAYPTDPLYPRQSTLTWFLLHILERAYAQMNSAFSAGANFIPHRLRKVLITYPSGWTTDEVDRYRERCQEALNIFSHTNVYHGVNSDLKLEMVSKAQTPDEAVAGQLPFVFSEIIRYPGQTAAKWISLVGKDRCGKNTVRIMNFDIGGGTSDISVVEYEDENTGSGASLNLLRTTLLFKDGQATAGDDLVKEIIERIILGGLIRTRGSIPGLAQNITRQFTQAFTNREDEAVRARIVRTCLIPLATKCLVELGGKSVQFSAQMAGINQNNWKEFLEFIGMSDEAIPFSQECFSFNDEEINELIERRFRGLFQNCAMYAAAYDIDLLIFSGKPSELPYIRTMANRYVPIDEGRIIFARNFKAGQWYPFTDDNGYIKDAKTVTVVGSALYYALSEGLISNWKITSSETISQRNEWGEIGAMKDSRDVFIEKSSDVGTITILPNTIIARRQNICSSPEPVYRFVSKDANQKYTQYNVSFERKMTDDGDSLSITSVIDVDSGADVTDTFKLQLWPCENGDGIDFWQEKGIFNI